MHSLVETAGALAPAKLPPDAADALGPGVRAGPWIVQRELGRGGMGTVYAVIHEDIGKRAALKVMHRRLVSGSCEERMLLEARVVNTVGHPNIVDIFETGALSDGRPYIVMERLEGVPLAVRASEARLLPDLVIAILLQVCDALIAAHDAGIVHRDLKLDNVFLAENPEDPTVPRVKLLDWGIAKVISSDVHQTGEGQLVGTPLYLAPEQARGGPVSDKTDVYSLGVMAFELFLEQLPFEAETSAEIMAMHLRAQPPAPRSIWPDIPPQLERLLLAMLAKAPAGRPTAREVSRMLEEIRADIVRRRRAAAVDPPAPARDALSPERRSLALDDTARIVHGRTVRWQLVVGALAIAIGVAMFAFTRDSDDAVAAPEAHATAAAIVPAPAPADAPTPLASAAPAAPAAPVEVPIAEVSAHRPAAPARAHRPARPVHHVKRRAPVTPRRSAPLAPDGTIDPYE
jgi:serine/threonine-protein kinase